MQARFTLFTSLSLALLWTTAAEAEQLCQTQTLLPYGDAYYRIQEVPHDSLAGFQKPDFNDAEFAWAQGAFGTRDGHCALNNPEVVLTPWNLNTDLLVRKTFTLPEGARNVTFHITIDNDVKLWLNGVLLSDGLIVHEGCPTRDSFTFTAPLDIPRAGTNLLAIRARDRGGLAFLDVRMTAEICVDAPETACPFPQSLDDHGMCVWHISGYDKTYAEASAACDNAGGRLCSLTEIEAAQAQGAQWCSWGWTSDELEGRHVVAFPMQSKSRGCGDHIGVVTSLKQRSEKVGANCCL